MASLNILTGSTPFIGPNVLSVLTGTIYVLMIVKLPMYGALSTDTLDALTLSVKLVASELLLISKLVMLLTALIFLNEVTVLVSEVSVNTQNVLNRWRHTA